MKMKKILISAVAAVCLMMIMTGCNVESGPDPDPPGDVADSILMFEKIKNNDKMLDDLGESVIPERVALSYDEESGKPEVTFTDPDDVMRIVELAGEIKVGSKSDSAKSGADRHIRFTLQDGSEVSYDFEGETLLRVGKEHYMVSGGEDLWAYVKTLQQEQDEAGE